MMSTKNRITINIDENKYQDLIILSNELDVSLSWLGRKALTDLLSKYDRVEKDEKGFKLTNILLNGS